jgi:hypothetical protein
VQQEKELTTGQQVHETYGLSGPVYALPCASVGAPAVDRE